MEKTKLPQWIKDSRRRQRAREQYFIRRYGSLERMYLLDGKAQQEIDDAEFEDEIAIMAEKHKQEK